MAHLLMIESWVGASGNLRLRSPELPIFIKRRSFPAQKRNITTII